MTANILDLVSVEISNRYEPSILTLSGPTISVNIHRGLSLEGLTANLDPGTMLITVDAPDGLSPVTETRLRPGNTVRVDGPLVDGQRQPLATMTIDAARVEIDKHFDQTIVIEASDLVRELSQIPAIGAIGGAFGQRISYATDQAGGAFVTVIHDATPYNPTPPNLASTGKTVLDQILIARDTMGGALHVDNRNQLQADDSQSVNGYPVAYRLTDREDIPLGPNVASYADIEIEFNTDELINVVTVNTIVSENETTVTVVTDQDSIDEWHTRRVETMTINQPGIAEDVALDYMRNKTSPSLRAKTITFNAKNNPHLATSIAINSRIQIDCGELIDAVYQVLAIDHAITATSWQTTLNLQTPRSLPPRWDDIADGLTWDSIPDGTAWNDAIEWRTPYTITDLP